MKITNPRTKLTIDREIWSGISVYETGESQLFMSSNLTYCCLGIACKKLYKIPDDVLDEVSMPSLIERHAVESLHLDSETFKAFTQFNSTLISSLVSIEDSSYSNIDLGTAIANVNDSSEMEREDKEALLIKLFDEYLNIELSFDSFE